MVRVGKSNYCWSLVLLSWLNDFSSKPGCYSGSGILFAINPGEPFQLFCHQLNCSLFSVSCVADLCFNFPLSFSKTTTSVTNSVILDEDLPIVLWRVK
jgi:hypothetical protein